MTEEPQHRQLRGRTRSPTGTHEGGHRKADTVDATRRCSRPRCGTCRGRSSRCGTGQRRSWRYRSNSAMRYGVEEDLEVPWPPSRTHRFPRPRTSAHAPTFTRYGHRTHGGYDGRRSERSRLGRKEDRGSEACWAVLPADVTRRGGRLLAAREEAHGEDSELETAGTWSEWRARGGAQGHGDRRCTGLVALREARAAATERGGRARAAAL